LPGEEPAPEAAGLGVAGRGLSHGVRATFQPPGMPRCGLAAAEPMLWSPTERRCRTVPPRVFPPANIGITPDVHTTPRMPTDAEGFQPDGVRLKPIVAVRIDWR
jgi:hypothetical protein